MKQREREELIAEIKRLNEQYEQLLIAYDRLREENERLKAALEPKK